MPNACRSSILLPRGRTRVWYKSGGGRIIYWYHSPGYPAVLLWVFAKNEADDLTAVQLNRLVGEAEWLIEDFGGKR
jgi:hypothetical protein